MNKQLLGFLIVIAIFTGLLWIFVHQSKSDQKTIDTAQRLIETPPHDDGAEIIFRKPRALGYMLILSFVAMCCLAAYSLIHYWGSPHTTTDRLRGLTAGLFVFLAVSPLLRGIRDLRYTARISPDELKISERTTKSVALRNIKDVRVKGSFCLIRMLTGEEDLKVASDLKNFPEFSLLCKRTNKIQGLK